MRSFFDAMDTPGALNFYWMDAGDYVRDATAAMVAEYVQQSVFVNQV
jgi:hypothetical protein